jgi:TPR repeat protein/membrane associated rhomboid family serine protease
MSSPDRFKPGPVTLATAGFLVVVFLLEVALSIGDLSGVLSPSIQVLVAMGGISKDLVLEQHQWWRLVAGPLLHGDLVHIVLNGLVLVFAGFLVEALVGKLRWIVIYGVGAIAGGLFSAFFNPSDIVSVGASGAGMALLAAVFVLAFALDAPAERSALQVTAARFLVPSLLPIATTRSGGHVDFAAHFGGAIGGTLVALALLPELKAHLRAELTPPPESPLRITHRRPLTPVIAPIAAGLVAFTAAGIAFTARDVPAVLVLQGRAKPASWMPWLTTACALRSTSSCFVAGKALARGDGVEKDADAAQRLLAPLCDKNDVDACFELGRLEYERKHFLEAATAWARACDRGELSSCHNQAIALENAGATDQEATIRARFDKACPTVPAACGDLAMRVYDEAPEVAFNAAKKGCGARDGFSCWVEAMCLADGAGTEKDLVKSRELHEQACTLGEVRGCNSLAIFLQRGWGGDVDVARAATLLDQACATGDPTSCANFAEALWEGKGIPADQPRARKLFEETCAAGVNGACHGLVKAVPQKERASVKEIFQTGCAANAATGCLYLGAVLEDHEADFAGADALYARACELGDAIGCTLHADMLEAGKGVAKDLQQAAEFYRRACEGGIERACEKTSSMVGVLP